MTRLMARLPDIVAVDLRVLIVAINPATAAAKSGRPFASSSNAFWPLLHASGLTSRRHLPEEAPRLLEDGMGLVSLVDRPTGAAAELRADEMRKGARRLATKVARWRPQWIALLGLTLTRFVLPKEDVPGPGPKASRFGGARVFVLPNPSGRNRAFAGFEAKLTWYRELARVVGAPLLQR